MTDQDAKLTSLFSPLTYSRHQMLQLQKQQVEEGMSVRDASCPDIPKLYACVRALLFRYDERIATLEEKCEELIDRIDLLEQEIEKLKDWLKE